MKNNIIHCIFQYLITLKVFGRCFVYSLFWYYSNYILPTKQAWKAEMPPVITVPQTPSMPFGDSTKWLPVLKPSVALNKSHENLELLKIFCLKLAPCHLKSNKTKASLKPRWAERQGFLQELKVLGGSVDWRWRCFVSSRWIFQMWQHNCTGRAVSSD